MRKLLLTAFIALTILLSACAFHLNAGSIEEITVYQTSGFGSDDLILLDSYIARDSIRTITKATNRSSKVAGAVDVDDPNYELVILSDEIIVREFYLWSSEMGSAVIAKEDTHSYYTIKEKHHKKLREMLDSL